MTLGITHGWTSRRINPDLFFTQTADEHDFITKIFNKKTGETTEHRHNRSTQREEATRLMNSNLVAVYKDRDGNFWEGKPAQFYADRDKQFYKDQKRKK